MNVARVMTHPARTVGMNSNLAEAAGIMWSMDCGALPVIDVSGMVVAMLTDLLTELAVRGAMSDSVVTCRPDDTLEDAERLMQEHQVRRLPVVNDRNEPVGMLSLSDLSRHASEIPAVSSAARADLVQTLAAVSKSRADNLFDASSRRL